MYKNFSSRITYFIARERLKNKSKCFFPIWKSDSPWRKTEHYEKNISRSWKLGMQHWLRLCFRWMLSITFFSTNFVLFCVCFHHKCECVCAFFSFSSLARLLIPCTNDDSMLKRPWLHSAYSAVFKHPVLLAYKRWDRGEGGVDDNFWETFT